MQYQHKPRFQIILHAALRAARASNNIENPTTGERFKYSDIAMVQVLGLDRYASALRKFRTQTSVPQLDDIGADDLPLESYRWRLDKEELARPLWELLRHGNHISNVMADKNSPISKKALYSERDVACALMAFFAVSENENTEKAKTHFLREAEDGHKTWICYKLSTRRPGYIIKSKFEISLINREYFRISDHQVSTGRTEKGVRFEEKGDGFGFVKGGWLWCVIRENEYAQPRIFCFWGLDGTGTVTEPIEGNVLEVDQLFGKGQFGLPVVLVDPEYDEILWRAKNPDKDFDLEGDQFDSFPFTSELLKMHIEQPAENGLNVGEDFSGYVHEEIRKSLTERKTDPTFD